jgi:molecular chaperone Hsp33
MEKRRDKGIEPARLWRRARQEELCIFTLHRGQVRGAILRGNQMIREMQLNHRLGIMESLILGQAYLGAAMLATALKGNDRLALQIECDGPVRGLNVEANAYGEVRGYLRNPQLNIDAEQTSFDTAPFIGSGQVIVTRYLEDAKQPFSGRTELHTGRLAEDITHYLWQSEQAPSAMHLSIHFHPDGAVSGAGALLLQALPECREELRQTLEEQVRALPSLGEAFGQDEAVNDFLQNHFGRSELQILERRKPAFMCHCNRTTISRLFTIMPEDDFTDLKQNGPFPMEVVCHYCATPYYFKAADLEFIYTRRQRRN